MQQLRMLLGHLITLQLVLYVGETMEQCAFQLQLEDALAHQQQDFIGFVIYQVQGIVTEQIFQSSMIWDHVSLRQVVFQLMSRLLCNFLELVGEQVDATIPVSALLHHGQ
jgi:hypothetical protein